MKKITMMQLRKQPGLYIFWEVAHARKSFVITNKGKPVAMLVPIKEKHEADKI